MTQVPACVFSHTQEPSSKTLTDRFKRLVVQRRTAVKRTRTASGIVEKYVEKEGQLDGLIAEIDEMDEVIQQEKNEQKVQEKRLVEAGASVAEEKRRKTMQQANGFTLVPTPLCLTGNRTQNLTHPPDFSVSETKLV